jgi:chromosome partitioning protein
MTTGADCRVIVLGGSKGGCGRSTIARNLLVAAGRAGVKAIGVDLDAQLTFQRWSERRLTSREKFPQIVPTEVLAAEVGQWADFLGRVADYKLMVVDTAPGVEADPVAMVELCRRATLVLVPTSTSLDDLESVAPWARSLIKAGARSVFVLNRANRRTRSYAAARTTLLKYGPLAPTEIPALEDIPASFHGGLAVVDYEKSKGADAMNDLWQYARMEVGL